MFNTTNVYILNNSTGQRDDCKADIWTKVIAVSAVVTMLLTAALVVFAIMALQRPTIGTRGVQIPTPVFIQQQHPIRTVHITLDATQPGTIPTCTQFSVAVARHAQSSANIPSMSDSTGDLTSCPLAR
jgi:hypothetical protein